MREVASEFANPVLLYSIGKNSSVMLHLAMKAFYPLKPLFPLFHVDTNWMLQAITSKRWAHIINHDASASMEKEKCGGYS